MPEAADMVAEAKTVPLLYVEISVTLLRAVIINQDTWYMSGTVLEITFEMFLFRYWNI